MKKRCSCFLMILLFVVIVVVLCSCSSARESDTRQSVRLNLVREALSGIANEFASLGTQFLRHEIGLQDAKSKDGYTFLLNDQIFHFAGIPPGQQWADAALREVYNTLLDVRTLNSHLSVFNAYVYEGLTAVPETLGSIEAQKDESGKFHFYQSGQEISAEQVIVLLKEQIDKKLNKAEERLLAWMKEHVGTMNRRTSTPI
ncbi:MAG: hypothetical protein ACYC99_11475 [Candidatus Geothermincolia bacterium]